MATPAATATVPPGHDCLLIKIYSKEEKGGVERSAFLQTTDLITKVEIYAGATITPK